MSRHPSFVRHIVLAASFASLLAVAACANVPPPVAEMATARTSVRSAESAGALESAPTEFLSAREKLAQAEIASRNEKYADARRLAEEATADADVAERKARAAKTAQTAAELQRANGVLANEVNRGTRP